MLANHLLFILFAFLVQGQINFPKLTLPWGTWQATNYDTDGEVSNDSVLKALHFKRIMLNDS